MRLILLLLCIFSVTLTAKAQFGKDWQEGSYYDTLGRKTTGLIAWSAPEKTSKKPGDHIFYKSDKKADKVKVEASSISAFTLGTDSFVVTHASQLQHAPFLQVCVNRPLKLYYSKVFIMSIGGAVLGGVVGGAVGGVALSQAMAGSGSKPAYYYGPNSNELYLLTGKNFIDVMSEIMADKPEIVDKIKKKKLRYGDITDLLTYYNTGTMPVHDDYYY